MNTPEYFPIGKNRKKIIQRNKEDIDTFKNVGKNKIERGHYIWTDSPVDLKETDRAAWSGEAFSLSFRDLLPKNQSFSLKDYIETTLESRRREAVGVEFGGVGAKLFSGFSPGFFNRSIGVTLVDHRNSDNLPVSNSNDGRISHEVLVGDIFDKHTYEDLNKRLENKKVDLIVSRMGKGLEFVPIEPYLSTGILKIWYDLLNDGGIMFVQIPVRFNNLLKEWAEKIDQQFKGKLEIEYTLGEKDSEVRCSSFRLRKLKDAPKDLPVLDPRVVKKTRVWYEM